MITLFLSSCAMLAYDRFSALQGQLGTYVLLVRISCRAIPFVGPFQSDGAYEPFFSDILAYAHSSQMGHMGHSGHSFSDILACAQALLQCFFDNQQVVSGTYESGGLLEIMR